MADFGKVEGRLTLDTSGVTRGVAIAKSGLREYASDVNAAAATTGKFGAIARTVGLAALAASATAAAGAVAVLRRKVGELDELNKLNQKTGLSTQALSKFAYAADLADLSIGGLATSMRFLNQRIVEAQDKGSKTSKIFERLGVDAGAGLEQVLLQTSDAFKRIGDTSERSRLAVVLFGKSGSEAIPFLLSDLRGAASEAERFGLVVSKATTQAAEDTNDNATRMKAALDGIATGVTAAVLPALADMSKAAADAFGDQARNKRFAEQVTDIAKGALFVASALGKVLDGISRIADAGRGVSEYIASQGAKNDYAREVAETEFRAAQGDETARLIMAQRRGATGASIANGRDGYTYKTPDGQFVGPVAPGLTVQDLLNEDGTKSKRASAAQIAAAVASQRASNAREAAGAAKTPEEAERLTLAATRERILAIKAATAASEDGVAAATQQYEIDAVLAEQAREIATIREKAAEDQQNAQDDQARAQEIYAQSDLDAARAKVRIAESELRLVDDGLHSTAELLAAHEALTVVRNQEVEAERLLLQVQLDNLLAVESRTAEQEATVASLREEISLRGQLRAAEASHERKQRVQTEKKSGPNAVTRVRAGIGQYLAGDLSGLDSLGTTGAVTGLLLDTTVAVSNEILGAQAELKRQRQVSRESLPGQNLVSDSDQGAIIAARFDRIGLGKALGALGGKTAGKVGSIVGSAAGGAAAGATIGGPIGAAVGGVVGAIAGVVGNLLGNAPTKERQIAEQVESLFGKAGLLNAKGLVQVRGPGQETRGGRDGGRVKGFGVVGALESQTDALGLALFGDKDYADSRFSNAFLNSRRELGLGLEESERELDKLVQHLQVTLPGAFDALNQRFLRGEVSMTQYRGAVAGLSDVLQDQLGPGIDAAAIALESLDARGVVEVGKFTRAAETALVGVGQGLSAVLQDALENDAAVSGELIGEAFSSAIIDRATERLLEAPTQRLLSDAAAKLDQAVAAKIAGNEPEFARLRTEGLAAFGEGQRAAVEFISEIVPDIQSLMNGVSGGARSKGVYGLPSFDRGGVVPGIIDMPRLVVAHGGETVFTRDQMGEMVGLLRQVAASAASKTPVVLRWTNQIGAREIQRGMEFVQAVREIPGSVSPSDVGAPQ